jgi:hypothetical protein
MNARTPMFEGIKMRPLLAMALVLFATGCAPKFIPNTDVEDSSKNRKIITFCEQYRHAVEEKNVGLLLKLAHEKYYEDGIDAAGLKDYLTTQFTKTNTIRYEIRYRRITFTETDRILVDYTYSASYKIPGAQREEWRHTVADNRLVIVPDSESFKILSGM